MPSMSFVASVHRTFDDGRWFNEVLSSLKVKFPLFLEFIMYTNLTGHCPHCKITLLGC